MQIIGFILIVVGVIVALVFGIKLLILAFKKSTLWGLASLFIPFVLLIFVIQNWAQCKGAFIKYLLSIPLIVIGAVLSGGIQAGQ